MSKCKNCKVMKRSIYLFFVLIFIMPLSAFSQDDAQIKKELQESYVSFLREEGFTPTVDSDGDVKFKYEGDIFYCCPSSDKKIFKIMRVLTDDNKSAFNKLLMTSNKTMKDYNRIRITVYKNEDNCTVVFRVDNLIVENDDYKKIFYRNLKVIQNAIKSFKEEYSKE